MSLAPPTGLPLEDPVVIVALSLSVFLVVPLLLRRFSVPGIIGILLVGTAIGPNGLGLLARDDTIVLLGTMGLVFLMFAAGLEVDVTEFLDSPDRSLVFGGLSFTLPMLAGAGVGVWLLGFDVATAALFAAAFASHTLLAFPVVDRLELGSNRAVATAISGTIVTDTLALLVLAVVETRVGGGSWTTWVWLAGGLAGFFVGTWWVVPRVGRWFFRNLEEESYFEFLFVASVVFAASVVAELVGAHAIVGAFLAGLSLNRLIPRTSTLMNRIEFVGEALFIPFFLLSVGMLVDPAVFVSGPAVWLVAGMIVLVIGVTKLAAAGITGRLYGFGRAEQLTIFGLTTGQAAATLAIVLIGFELGLFDRVVVNGVVLMILVVGVASPLLTERFGRDLVDIEEDREFESAPERVLIPVDRYDEATERLLDLAMLVRGSGEESLYALAVVHRHAAGAADERVAEAEERLDRVEEYVSGADVPVETLTRSEASAVAGVVRAVEDNRITSVVTAPSGGGRFGGRFFGTATEQLVERTDRQVLLADVRRPVNTASGLVLVLPPRVGAHPGFLQGVHTAKRLVEETGLPLRCVVVGGDADRYEALVEQVDPVVPFEVETVPGWGALGVGVESAVHEDDLVLALTPREGERGWDPGLRTLSTRLAGDGPVGVVTVHLAESRDRSRRHLLSP